MRAQGNWPSTQMTLIERIARPDDAEAWERFYKVYTPLILRFCQRLSLQHTDAEDICQNVIQSMRRSLPNYATAKGRFRFWLSQVIRREIWKHLEKERRSPQGIGGDIEAAAKVGKEPAGPDEILEYIINEATRQIRPEFTADEWVVMLEVVLKGRKPRDLGAEKGWDAPWISRAKYRLIKRLKEVVHFLENSDPEEWAGSIGTSIKEMG